VSQARGDVLGPGEAESADGEVAPGGHRAGRVACPQTGGVLGERGIPDVVRGLYLPVVTYELGELGRIGLFGSEAGDGVDGLEGDLAGLAVGVAAA